MNKNIIFLGNGRCYHTLDWFRSAQQISPGNPPILITDLIDGESFVKLLKPSDFVEKLIILDQFLFKNQSRQGNIWRNILKLVMAPAQILILRKLLEKYKNPVIHAHSMYYIALARFTSVKYVATPQGSEVLVRPFKSQVYKLFSRIAFSKASCITVDSKAMQQSLQDLYGKSSELVQNGIDIDEINQLAKNAAPRNKMLSIRAVDKNYQIDHILDARNGCVPQQPITFCYPFVEDVYKESLKGKMINLDQDLGRLPRLELYKLMLSAKLVISIPVSDSSPRSVFEAIFCGCFVAVTYNQWQKLLPDCMSSRVIIVNIKSATWLRDAIDYVEANISSSYSPSQEALNLYDQKHSMLKFYNHIYPSIAR
jgi:hypothetical protein